MKEKSKNCNKQRGRLIEEIPFYTLWEYLFITTAWL